MTAGVIQVVVGLFATLGMLAFWMLVIVVVPMVVTLYVFRFIPLSGRRPKKDRPE